jgi:hypothetical protein
MLLQLVDYSETTLNNMVTRRIEYMIDASHACIFACTSHISASAKYDRYAKFKWCQKYDNLKKDEVVPEHTDDDDDDGSEEDFSFYNL